MRRHLRPRPAFAAVVAVGLLLTACGDGDDDVADDTPVEEVEDVEDVEEEPEPDPTEEPEAPAEPEESPEPEPTEDGSAAGEDDGAATDTTSASGPTPDASLVDAPCAMHDSRTMESFIEVVAPVDDQVATGGTVDLVGCSNVFEATVNYRLLDGDGRTLDEGFTTAECGSGCVGEFRETLDLSAAEGEPVVYLQVHVIDAATGDDDLMTERIVVLG